jgi:hypothetical protein
MPMVAETSIASSFSDIVTIGTSMLTFIEGNALLMVCFAGCLVKIGSRLIKGARKAVGA